MRSRVIKRLLLVSLSLGIGLLMAEIAARLLIWRDDRQVISESLLDPLPIAKGGFANAWHVIRLSPNPRLIYELKPGLDVDYMGGLMTTNSVGFRSPERKLEKPPGTYRIVALGDSVGMGWRVNDADSLMALTETYLNKKFPSKNWEVINTSVLGYNTAQELETLKVKGLAYKPDLVIVNFVPNDIELPAFVRQRRNYFQLDHAFLSEFLKDRLGLQRRHSGLMVVDPKVSVSREVLSNPKLVPPEYADMVGWDNYKRQMAELRALSLRENFKVLMVFHPDFIQEAADVAQQNGFQIVNGALALKQFMDKHNMTTWGPPMSVGPIYGAADGHPSRLANMVTLAPLLHTIGQMAGVEKKPL